MGTKQKRELVAARVELHGLNGPVDQRDDYKEAKKTCDMRYRGYTATAGCGNTRIHPREVQQRPDQQFDGLEEDSYRIGSETGWKYYIPATTTVSSSSSSSWWRPSDSWWTAWNWDSSSWNEQQFFFSSRCENFSLTGSNDCLVNDGLCTQNTLSHAFFSCAQSFR